MSQSLLLSSLGLVTMAWLASAQSAGFDVRVAELNGIRMISTSDNNYAITNPNFLQNWRTVSVNGDEITIITRDNQIQTKSLSNASDLELQELLRTKSQLGQVFQFGGGRGGTFNYVNINNNNNNNNNNNYQQQAKYATYSSSGSQMSMGGSNQVSIGGNNQQMSNYNLNGISFSMGNGDDFSVIRADNMPFNWSKVFVDGDILTTVLDNGQVYMKPLAAASPDELQQIEKLRMELRLLSKQQQEQFAKTMESSMNTMNNMLGNMFGQLNPAIQPQSTSGWGVFGKDFPFGPYGVGPFGNGFPFNNGLSFATTGSPFGQTGSFAGAFAGR